MDPDQTAPIYRSDSSYRGSLMSVHTVCLWGFKYFGGRQKIIHFLIMRFKGS